MNPIGTSIQTALPRAVESRQCVSVVTRVNIAATCDEVWKRLMFYEQIDRPPPLHLRFFLPLPLRTAGRKSEIGDEVKCLYAGGHLLKRITHVDRDRSYVFDVVEQDLDFGGGIRLLGGSYSLSQLPNGYTRVELRTRYVSHNRPRWLCRMIESVVCHMFHRYILSTIRSDLDSATRHAKVAPS